MRSRHVLVVGLLAFLVYLPGITWGAPHATGPDRVKAWGVDDETPMGPLAEVSHIVFGPAPDRNLGYPLLHSFTVAAAYAPYLGLELARGRFSPAGAEFPFGFEDPVAALRMLTIIAHLVSVLAAVLVVLAAYYAANELWDHRTGIIASVFAMTMYPMFYYGRTANVDALQLAFMAMCLAAFARWLSRDNDTRAMIWLGVFGGLALATKEPIFASFLAIPFVVITLQWRRAGPGSGPLTWTFWKAPVLGMVALVLAFGVGSGLFVDPERFFAHIEFARSRVAETNQGGTPFAQNFPNTLAGNAALLAHLLGYIVDSLTLPGTLLAVGGVFTALIKSPRTAVLALPTITYVLVLFVAARIGFLRYLMPAAFPLTLFAAYAVSLAWDAERRPVRYAVAAVALLALGLGALRGLDLTHAMIVDSRHAAGDWLAENAPQGAAVEYFGPSQKLPRLRTDMVTERAVPYLGGTIVYDTSDAAVREIADGWAQRRPDFIVLVPDYTSPGDAEHSSSVPPGTFAGLLEGRFGYELAGEFKSPDLLPWVKRPKLDYNLVNPPIRIFRRTSGTP